MLSDKDFAEIKELEFEVAVNTAYNKGFSDGYDKGVTKSKEVYLGIIEERFKGV